MMETKTNKTKFRKYLNKVWAYRCHWITSFNILEFDKYKTNEENYKLFSNFAFNSTWASVKIKLFLKDYEILKCLKIKKLKGGLKNDN